MAMTGERPVLVATEVNDVTADMVIAHINQRGVASGPIQSCRLRHGFDDVGSIWNRSVTRDRADLVLRRESWAWKRVGAVYWRRPVWPLFEHLQDADAQFATAQVRYGLGGTLYGLQGCLWLNHPLRNAAADYKPTQLALAHRMGFSVPPTLVTNDPNEARRFIREHRQVIHKALRWTPYQRDGVGLTSWAEPVSAEELDETVRFTPHLFQARVDKVADLRVLIVGRRTFAVRIDSDLLDWRRDYSALTYSVVELPNRMEKTLLAYLDHFGLASGSFDLAVDRDGAFHWLELNPNGQWGWLEERTGLEMAAAFAQLLVEGSLAEGEADARA